jgi:outer membrane protein assembly factor BamB
VFSFPAFSFLLLLAAVGSVASAAAPSGVKAGDWAQFHGPHRDAKCAETGLLKEWPDGGPKLLWKLEGLGRGYSTVAISDGKILTMGDRRPKGGSEKQFVIAYDLAGRKELWATAIGPPHGDGGPRCTPTVDGELLYAIGTSGDLVCLETARGKLRWKKSFEKDFGGRMMSGWRYSESPLVDGKQLVCTPGGKDATIVALDKATGEMIWKCGIPKIGSRGNDGAGYSSMVAADVEGVRQYIQILGRGAVGVAADSGKFLWGYNRVANGTANIPSPVVRENLVFVSTAYGAGSALLRLGRQGEEFKAEEVYYLGPDKFSNHHGGMVLVGDHLYAGDGQNKGTPICLDFETGQIAWKPNALAGGSAAVLYADGNLVFRYESGLVALIEATPAGFHVKGKFEPEVKDGPAWPHPVIHAGRLYLRANDTLMCYEVGGKE